jgi:hypothetical protein
LPRPCYILLGFPVALEKFWAVRHLDYHTQWETSTVGQFEVNTEGVGLNA